MPRQRRRRVANPFRALKEATGLSWREIAELLGASYSTVRKYGCETVTSVSNKRALEFERRSHGKLKAGDVVAWSLDRQAAA